MLSIILTIVVVGFLLWLVTTYVPMEPAIRQVLVAVVVLCLVLWLLGGFLGWHFRDGWR